MDSFLDLPARHQKPRKSGITSVIDTGLTLQASEALLNDYADYIDVFKLTTGTGYLTPRLNEKIALFQSAGIDIYLGGTLSEKCIQQGKFDQLLSYLARHNIEIVEISNGVIDLNLDEMRKLIEDTKSDFRVLAEVGSKDKAAVMPPSKWVLEMQTYLDAGAEYVITEGRESGTAGVFRESGEMRTGLVEEISLNIDLDKVIFEAPTQASQMYFINIFGANVNLGNIRTPDILLLETQRRGLRYETFDLK